MTCTHPPTQACDAHCGIEQQGTPPDARAHCVQCLEPLRVTSNFEKLGTEIGRTVQEKNAAYGDSFLRSGEVLRILYPTGVQIDQYGDMLAVVRIVDKLFRIATDRDALGESPFRDIAGYGILGASRAPPPKPVAP